MMYHKHISLFFIICWSSLLFAPPPSQMQQSSTSFTQTKKQTHFSSEKTESTFQLPKKTDQHQQHHQDQLQQLKQLSTQDTQARKDQAQTTTIGGGGIGGGMGQPMQMTTVSESESTFALQQNQLPKQPAPTQPSQPQKISAPLIPIIPSIEARNDPKTQNPEYSKSTVKNDNSSTPPASSVFASLQSKEAASAMKSDGSFEYFYDVSNENEKYYLPENRSSSLQERKVEADAYSSSNLIDQSSQEKSATTAEMLLP